MIEPGRYEENVNVTKKLNITSLHGAEIVAKRSDEHVFKLVADKVIISNLRIRANK
ncbi:MAG: hypothetical protein NZ894_05725 [Archaeoglobaceae archaeon]|nr:hypothetical protein [Archaeoglobaceae archaeon]